MNRTTTCVSNFFFVVLAFLFAGTVQAQDRLYADEFPLGDVTLLNGPLKKARDLNISVLMQGELTIIGQDGKKKVVHEGEPVVEMVNTIHHGENTGDKPVILYMFYLSQKDMPLAVQHPEIPLE